MRLHLSNSNNWLTGFGMTIISPLLIAMGAVVVIVLSTPVMLAVTVIGVATALLMVGTMATRNTAASEDLNEDTDTLGEEASMCETVDMIPVMELEAIGLEVLEPEVLEPDLVEMVDALTDAPNETVYATVTKVFGPCPLGMMPGNSWKIGPDGKLSRPMCRPAATALNALFRMTEGDATNRSVGCECLYAGRELTFTVREPEEEMSGKPG